eukprot:4708204-Prymnesium_polylepis.1
MLAGFKKVALGDEASAKVKTTTYDKSTSFFDTLDEEVPEEGPRKGRAFMDEMRKLDSLTFGEELMRNSRGGKGGRPRGGGGRGGKGGGGGGDGDGTPREGGKGKGKGDRTPREGVKGGGKGK